MKPAIPRALSALVFLFALWWAHQHWQGDSDGRYYLGSFPSGGC